MADFLQHLRAREFSLKWDTYLIQPPYNPECPGAVGRYGPGYSYADHQRDKHDKYGIRAAGFVVPRAIELNFTIKHRKGYDYLCQFADAHGYQRPKLRLITFRGDVKQPEELKHAEAQNNALKKEVAELCNRLNELTNLSMDPDNLEIEDMIDTSLFYAYYNKEVYPLEYQIVETDKQRINDIWFQTNIMRDC